MVDIVKALNQKTEPLAKKADNLGVPKPTQPNLASALGATDKSAQMAPTPQAQMASQNQATQKQTSEQQRTLRSAQVQTQAPRDIAGAADMNAKAANIIGAIADTINAERVQGAVDTSVDPATGRMTRGQLFDMTRSGTELKGPEGKDIDLSDMGETFNIPVSQVLSPEELSEITGVFGPEAANMTIDQLQARVEEEADAITAQVDDNREILNDPNQPPDIRKVARQNMIDLGAAHLIATDAELDAFEQDLSKADAIEIGGQTYSLEDLQDNEKVMAEAYKIAAELLNDPDQSAEDFNTSESFFNFVKNHANAIQSVFEENKKMYEEEILPKVEANKKVLGWTADFSRDQLNALGLGGFDVYKNNNFSDLPGLEVFRTGSSTDQALLKQMAGLDPRLVGQFLKTNDKNLLNRFRERKQDIDAIDGYTSPEKALSLFGVSDYNRLKQLVAEGMDRSHPVLSLLDSDGNGQIDDWSEVQRRLKNWALRGKPTDISGMKTNEERYQVNVQNVVNRISENSTVEDINRAIAQLTHMNARPEDIRPLQEQKYKIIHGKRDEQHVKIMDKVPKMTTDDPNKAIRILDIAVRDLRFSGHPEASKRIKEYTDLRKQAQATIDQALKDAGIQENKQVVKAAGYRSKSPEEDAALVQHLKDTGVFQE